ncbi:hypothetical protein DPMN_080452 [Dreissena polymorpha]|uniref:Uncharacterized protein n=1 Tax=Dreissena polymorpha TaxID=45954 RepID=A0A9D3YQW8_DREPO|nr:hypothetical protein DPMN_080452 [Dreissena polymorpha]
MSEVQRTQLLLSMSACSEMNSAMHEFSGQTYETSPEHKECSKSRLQRDNQNRATFKDFPQEHNPFLHEQCLRNIQTGALAEKNVNMDDALSIGQNIIKEMEERNVLPYCFMRTNQVVTLGSKNNLKVEQVMKFLLIHSSCSRD